jgi:hypothetical protein
MTIEPHFNLCEAYMRIEPHINLWNYFFLIQLRPDSDAEILVWGCTDIFLRTGQGVNPYLCLSIRPTRRVAERMILPEERHRCAAPCGYG